LANTNYPGWEVEVDGETTTLYKANLAFQAVAIPAGGADVTLRYTPNNFTTGLFISAASLFICLILIALGLFRSTTEN
jgi:uncharacterized membrane protein YfhO